MHYRFSVSSRGNEAVYSKTDASGLPFCLTQAMVAVQMAGAAFIPLDIGAPLTLNQGIMDAVKATVVLTLPEYRDFMVSLGVKMVLDIDESALEGLPYSGRPKRIVQPDNASYVVFTSASAGRPKGIVMDHRAACTSLDAYGSAAGIGPGTRVFQFSSIVFDAGIIDNLGTLMRGGCVCIPSDDDRFNNLANTINSTRANFAFLTPTVADMLSPSAVPGLETLVMGGEAVGQKSGDRWVGHVDLIGVYGPTEATAVSAINLSLGKAGKSTNIGRPLSSAYWVVEPDDPRRLVPTGCVGELLIQGPLLDRGCIDPSKEDQAATAWLDKVNWFSDSVGGPAYPTGDLVRRNENSAFDFVGRKDTQAKIHGKRVELGEIQAIMLSALPEHLTGIVEIVPSSPEDAAPDTMMAFIWAVRGPRWNNKALDLPHSPSEQEAGLISSLYGSLGVSLPSYMVPTVYLCLEGAPERAVSGKVNRPSLISFGQAIPADQRLRFTPGEMQREPPSTPMELAVQEIWAQLLNIPPGKIGKQSNFLRLGGDSLSAIQLVTRCRKRGIDLTVQSIFHEPRLVAMAAAATTITGDKRSDRAETQETAFSMLQYDQVDKILSQIQSQCGLSSPDQIADAYPCTTAQAGYMSITVNQPFSRVAKHAFPLGETVDLGRFKRAWEQTAAKCPILRTRIVRTDVKDSAGRTAVQAVIRNQPQWEQGLDQLDLRAAIETMVSKGTGYGTPLCRFAVIYHKVTGRQVFVRVVHHSLYDGWAVNMFYRMLNNIYFGLPAIMITPFTRFIRYTLEIDHPASRSYWREQLRGAKPAQFPPFRNTQAVAVPANSERTNLVHEVIVFPGQHQATITKATIFRAAWAILLARHDNTDDVTFGAASSGRKAPLQGMSSTLGPAIAYVPVRVRFPDPTKTTTTEFLQQLQLQAADMVAHEQYGVDRISHQR